MLYGMLSVLYMVILKKRLLAVARLGIQFLGLALGRLGLSGLIGNGH
jgi:hypothetical protein